MVKACVVGHMQIDGGCGVRDGPLDAALQPCSLDHSLEMLHSALTIAETFALESFG